jgi:ABC-type transport system involved in multi-copper enzyme maturation permease subunit
MHMIADVFYYDFLIAERRGRQHWLRWVYAAYLLLLGCWVFSAYVSNEVLFNHRRVALLSGAVQVLDAYLVHQVVLMLLLVPALAAGAVSDEKMRGTLQHLLTTEISAGQLLLGKLLARTAQVYLLFLQGLPLICILGGMVGLDPATLLVLLAAQVIPVAALVAVSLLASVWFRTTRDAVIAVYALGIAVYVLIRLIGGSLRFFDPLFVLAPLSGSDELSNSLSMGRRLTGSITAWGILGMFCLSIAVLRLRPVHQFHLENAGAFGRRRHELKPRPPVGTNPVHWREQYVEGLNPARPLRFIPRWVGLLAVFIISLSSSLFILLSNLTVPIYDSNGLPIVDFRNSPGATRFGPGVAGDFLGQAVVALLVSSLVVGIRCSGAIVGEREKRTWEALLVTPLTASELVRGKLWAVMGASYPYLAAYAVPAVLCSAITVGSALFYTVACLAGTVLAMYSIGAVGLYFSVRSKTSWRSLVATLGFGYGVVSLASLIPSVILTMLFSFLLALLEHVIQADYGPSQILIVAVIGASGGFGFVWLLFSHQCLKSAQKWIAQRDRIRRWEDLPPRLLASRRGRRPR